MKNLPVLMIIAGIMLTSSSNNSKPCIHIVFAEQDILYYGPDNKFDVFVNGKLSDQANISTNAYQNNKLGNGAYSVSVNNFDSTIVSIEAEGYSQVFGFKVKPLPDPTPKLGRIFGSGDISVQDFKEQAGMGADNNGHRCDVLFLVMSYDMTRISEGKVYSAKTNIGERYNEELAAMVALAKPGDYYIFNHIKARSYFDKSPRELGSVVYCIK